jgi:Ca2+-binding EF-hand superfamily protein
MQFFSVIALAAALSLGAGSRHLRQSKQGDGPPKCVEHCGGDVCNPDCDKSKCDAAAAAVIAGHCGEHEGPPDCVKGCENACNPDCDKTDCSAEDMAVIDGHCAAQSDERNETVIVDPLDNQLDVNVAKDIHDRVASMENCDDADCSPIVVENCKKLWEDKLKVCAEHAEEWAYQCPAPTYDGHNCKAGCCSKVAQDVQEGKGGEMPPPDEMWEYMSGDDDTINREELAAGFTVKLPPILGPYAEKFTDCMMMAYDVSGDGKVDETEFMDGYGKYFETCLEHSVPPEVMAEMAGHGDDFDPKAEWEFIAGKDGKASVEDLAASISRDMPPFEPYSLDLSQCIIEQVDSDGDGEVSYDEFVESGEQDPMEPCMHHIPDEVWAEMAVGQDEHWCTYTDPEEETCCKLKSHEEQDECYAKKMEDAHYCDFTGPEDEPCCAKQDRADQEACLEEKGIHVLGQKKRKTHLLNDKVRSSFRQFILKRFIRTKRSSKMASKHASKKESKDARLPSSKKTNVKTMKGSKTIKLNPKLSNKLSSNSMKLKPTAHSK